MHAGTTEQTQIIPAAYYQTGIAVGIALALWLAIVLSLAGAGLLVTSAGQPPFPIAIGVLLPIFVFVWFYRNSTSFKNWVLAAPAALITALMAWRFAGLGFLALYAHKVLPGMFAWPAGVGDIIIGIMAPWLAMRLVRRPGYINNRFFIAWNWFGIIDLVIAISTGALGSLLATGAAGEITTKPMTLLPLSIIPTFLVPLMVMMHITILLKARHYRADSKHVSTMAAKPIHTRQAL
jgi:hypothetical protein